MIRKLQFIMYFCPSKQKSSMNYEELLASKNQGRMNATRLPIGDYYRTQVDGKYRGVVDIREEMLHNIVFTKALEKECEQNKLLMNPHQLHFEPLGEGSEIRQLQVEIGTFLSMKQLLDEQPAVVAEKGFIDQTLEALVNITTYLHEQGIRHICYSPSSVLVRKGDNKVMLLSHGSNYQGISDQRAFYGDDARFVAPEVLEHGTVDDRCDVYGIGKLMEVLFERAEMPLEYKMALKKAVSPLPEDRFATPEDMLQMVQNRRNTKKSVITFAVAAGIALLCVGIYFEMFPESHQVEFVKPAAQTSEDDMLDKGFSPDEIGVGQTDSLDTMTVVEHERDYQAKAEQIFRKNYEKEAERILSKIYNKDYMSKSEKRFLAENQETLKELMELQQKMGEEASLTPEHAQVIASEIIERITNEKKKALK